MTIETTTCERDLGVTVSSSGKSAEHIKSVVSKANRILRMCIKTFTKFTPPIAKIIYPTFIGPHLEFAMPAWEPHLKGEIDSLERVPRRATKRVYVFKNLDYQVRLQQLGLSSLSGRRIRGDLVQMYKIQILLYSFVLHG